MSIEAIGWVLKQDIAPSSKKFVLMCFANYADALGFAYPSMAQLAADTSQDRKTVLASVQRLVADNLLRDTGERVGSTRQIAVYQIIGLPDSSRVHYVYKLTHPVTGEFYVGKRSFNGHPEMDTYRGSGRWPVAMKAEGTCLLREVLETFDSDAEAQACELSLIRRADQDPLCRNEDTPSRFRARQAPFDPKSPENGHLLEGSRFCGETVPLFPEKGPEIPAEAAQKRDTEPSRNRQVTVKGTGALLPERPEWLPPEWDAFVADRKERRKALSTRAAAMAMNELAALRAAGQDPAAVLLQSIRKGWAGLFAVKEDPAAGATLADRNRAAAEAFKREHAEEANP
jgi:hypothetical protein